MNNLVVEVVARTIAQVANQNEWHLSEAMQWADDQGILFYWYNGLYHNQFGGWELFKEVVAGYVSDHLERAAIEIEFTIITIGR